MSDKTLQQLVADELEFEPSVNGAHIGATADEGVVTLTGHVSGYAEKMAAEHAAERVAGVKGIANEIEVRYPGGSQNSDDEIAKRAPQVLSWDLTIPRDKIRVEVEKGWVTLTGDVEWYFEKSAADNDVHKLHGVVGFINRIPSLPCNMRCDSDSRSVCRATTSRRCFRQPIFSDEEC